MESSLVDKKDGEEMKHKKPKKGRKKKKRVQKSSVTDDSLGQLLGTGDIEAFRDNTSDGSKTQDQSLVDNNIHGTDEGTSKETVVDYAERLLPPVLEESRHETDDMALEMTTITNKGASPIVQPQRETSLQEESGVENLGFDSEKNDVDPPISDGCNVMPAISDGSNVIPPISDDSNVMPAINDGSNVMPAINDGSNVMPAINDGSNVIPAISDGSNVIPAISDDSNVIPPISDDSNVMPAINDGSNVIPAIIGDGKIGEEQEGKGEQVDNGEMDKMTDLNDELPWAMYRTVDTSYDKSTLSEDEWLVSDEEGIQDMEEERNLPDLYALLESLEENKHNLLNSRSMSNLGIFEGEKQQMKHQYIDELKLQMAENTNEKYLEEFHEKVEDEILMIGNISLEDVQDEERRLREEHIQYEQQQNSIQRKRQEDILIREELAKKTIMAELKTKRKALMRREEHLMQRDRLLQNKIHQAFRRSEHHLLKALEARKAEVKTMYGELVMADGDYGGSKGRRWKIDWNRSPQPIQVKLKCLRGIKDKLPAGRYVLMASLHDRLGGHVMKWSNLKGQQWGGATLPLFHEGDFYNIEMKIDQSVFTVCPPRPAIRPGMLLVFELFLLRGAVTPTDRVVGWGCFPICDSNFKVVEGKYKTPFLRGDMDPGIDVYQRIEKLMADDIDNWLCNLYFEVVLLPRYMAGHKEYEVELQFTSNILGHPNRTNTGENSLDGENPVYGSRSDIQSSSSIRKDSKVSSIMEGSHASEAKESEETDENHNKFSLEQENKQELSLSKLERPDSGHSLSNGSVLRPSTVLHTSRKLVEPANVLDGLDEDDEDSNSDYCEHEIDEAGNDGDFKPVKGKPGMYYKKHLTNPVDTYHRKLYTMLPKTPLLSRRTKKKRTTHLEELEQHSFSVKKPWTNKGRIPHRGTEKMQYIGRQFFAELGLSQWRSREFWAMILMLLLTWFIRIYAHYAGQWVYLNAIFIPINKFKFLPYTTTLNYQSTLLQTRQEISLVVLGPFTNILLFCVMVFISWLIQSLFGRFSNIISRFVMAYGINTLFDPLWILVVDTALKRYQLIGGDVPIGDAYKLYWHFDRYEKNGIIGIFITVFLYIVTIFTTSTILYMYFLRVHNSGRLLDIYHRLNAAEDKFFIPYDLEISLEEMTFICRKAEQWRGEEGERRKVAVYDYIWEEQELDADKMWDKRTRGLRTHREVTSHTSIHTIYLDGLRELYRHFLRLPNGAIVEVFGEMPLTGVDETIKEAIVQQRSTFDNLQPCTTHVPPSRPPSSCTTPTQRRQSATVQFQNQHTPDLNMLNLPTTSNQTDDGNSPV